MMIVACTSALTLHVFLGVASSSDLHLDSHWPRFQLSTVLPPHPAAPSPELLWLLESDAGSEVGSSSH